MFGRIRSVAKLPALRGIGRTQPPERIRDRFLLLAVILSCKLEAWLAQVMLREPSDGACKQTTERHQKTTRRQPRAARCAGAALAEANCPSSMNPELPLPAAQQQQQASGQCQANSKRIAMLTELKQHTLRHTPGSQSCPGRRRLTLSLGLSVSLSFCLSVCLLSSHSIACASHPALSHQLLDCHLRESANMLAYAEASSFH